MITSSIFLIFIGCLFLYHTSKKASLKNNLSIKKWIYNNTSSSKIIGVLLLCSSLVLAVFYFGQTSGILFWLFATIMIFSLVIITYPLQEINYKLIFVGFIVLFIIELLSKI